jgi:nucleotide-binding universal stress UspA family protein
VPIPHSRVREMLFGGVTEHALTDAILPVLLVH